MRKLLEESINRLSRDWGYDIFQEIMEQARDNACRGFRTSNIWVKKDKYSPEVFDRMLPLLKEQVNELDKLDLDCEFLNEPATQ